MSEKMRSDRQIGQRLRLRDLSVFSAVAEHGSMAKAAAELGVTQPSVSEVIADLESAYGAQLFDRSPRGVQLTAYGEALLRRTVVVFDEIRQSAMDIQSIGDPTRGEVRLACWEGLSATILPDILVHFAQRHPRVIVHVDTVTSGTAEVSNLRNRLYDLALMRLDDAGVDRLDDDLNISTLYDDQLAVAVGAGNPWARRENVRLADLIDEPWILSPPGFWHYARTEEAFRAQGLALPQARILTVTVTLRMHLMAAGPYISVFTTGVMQQIAPRFSIVALPIKLRTSRPWPVVVVTVKNRTQRPVVERFIQSAREVAKSFTRDPTE